MTVLVTGATGTVGREVVRALLARGASVRALTRDPTGTEFDPAVEVVTGDLTDLESVDRALEDIEALHLITFSAARGAGGGDPLTNADGLIQLIGKREVRRVTVLQNGYPGPIEEGVRASDLGWTMLQPVEFMANAREWTESIRTDGRVVKPYVGRVSSMVHEGDIGDVTAVALTEDGHAQQTYVITGPQVLSLQDKVNALAAATGRSIELAGLSDAEAVAKWQADGLDAETIGFMQWIYGNPPEVGTTVSDTVPRLTGQPGRTFTHWAEEHADTFRPAL